MKRKPRNIEPTPERWQEALRRAIKGNVRVAQEAESGQWIAMSDDNDNAYTLTVVNSVVHGCTCQAAEFGDSVCRHRAAMWHKLGMLDLDDGGRA